MTLDTKPRIPLAEAERLAGELVGLLGPYCERIVVAGSIRRRRPTIGDVELVCIPRMHRVEVPVDLFGTLEVRETNLLDHFCSNLVEAGTFEKRPGKDGRMAWGSKAKRGLYKGFGFDLFPVIEPAQFGVIYLIRTGSAEFSHRFVTTRVLGGWMPHWLRCNMGAIWRGGELVPTPEEEDVFDLVGREWVPPERREV